MKIPYIKAIIALSLPVLLASCASTTTKSKPRTVQSSLCSCANYLPERPRPGWVDSQRAEGMYVASGMAACSSLKSEDFDAADLAARSSLAQIISSDVQSQLEMKQMSIDAVTSEQVSSVIRQQSSALLSDSVIFDRWFDRDTCTLYSAGKVSRENVERAIAEKALNEQRKLTNQTLFLKTKGNGASRLKMALMNALTKSGVNKLAVKRDSRLTLESEVKVSDSQSRLVTVQVRLRLLDNLQQQVIWTSSKLGRGASHYAKPHDVLLNLAIEDALDGLTPSLVEKMRTGQVSL